MPDSAAPDAAPQPAAEPKAAPAPAPEANTSPAGGDDTGASERSEQSTSDRSATGGGDADAPRSSAGQGSEESAPGGHTDGDPSRGELDQRVSEQVPPTDSGPVREVRESWRQSGDAQGEARDAAQRAAGDLGGSWDGEPGRQATERAADAADTAGRGEQATRAVTDQLEQTAADLDQAGARRREAIDSREDLFSYARHIGPEADGEVVAAQLEDDAVREVTAINTATAQKVGQDWDALAATLAEEPTEPGAEDGPMADALDFSESVAQAGLDLSAASQDLENTLDETGEAVGDWLADTGAGLGELVGGAAGAGIGRGLGEGLADDVEAMIDAGGEVVEGGGKYLGNALETSGNATREIVFNTEENDPMGALYGAATELGEGIGNGVTILGETAGERTTALTGQWATESQEDLADAQEALEEAGKDAGGAQAQGDGPVVFYPRTDYTPEQMTQMHEHVRLANEALARGRTAPQGRVSTKGLLRTQASEEAHKERLRALNDPPEYQGVVGHAPDTTWTGYPKAYAWHDEHDRVNSALGGQARRYPIGWEPTEFVVGPPIAPGTPLPPR